MKLAAYLPLFGWQPTVLAPATHAHPRDESLAYPENHVVRSRALEISHVGKGLVGDDRGTASHAAFPRVRTHLRSFAHRFLYFPDAQIGWYPFAVRAGRSTLERERFDAIFSSSVPITAHLVARTLHRETGIPWIAEFRDPWADVTKGARKGDRRDRLERALVREANAVVTVSSAWRDRFVEKGAVRAHVVTNGFDPADLPEATPADGLVVTHLGTHHPDLQDLRSVWDALARIRATEPGLPMRLRFVGELDSAVRADVQRRGLADVLEVTGLLPHRAALAATAASSVLVGAGFDTRRPLANGLLPAKIFEYLGTGLPIVYVDSPDSDAARLLAAQPGCRVAAPGDVDGVFNALIDLRGQGRFQRDLARFTRCALAGRLAEVLESVCR